ncbi:chemotaxis protein CheB [Pseudogulbenkiania subflava]|uniref:protein-glutamate methylesterase n=1 Tax=Pseudogulbenkiania subflava DSM 22618 TaxID=1123014 RepID=A0A1Y6C1M1_9NEIS|nr:chemotaxis protein CheB [Pseudogulbenkiania subflava]SMF31648.1 two-component system, chemotaxis family, response regulator CheB [Pseudogulbenkiania subflava DSM 22618]
MRVMVIDDSSVARQLLRSLLESEGYEVVEADSGLQALELVARVQPDLVTMDVHMPGLDGFDTTRRLLEGYAVPVVIVTASANTKEAGTVIRALAAGALAVVEKPRGPLHPQFCPHAAQLIQTLQRVQTLTVRPPPPGTAAAGADPACWDKPIRLVAIGASAGGPAALKVLLGGLNSPCPWPILLVQHIAGGFLDSLRDWLSLQSTLPVHIARPGEPLQPGHLYLSPEAHHLAVSRDLRFRLGRCEPQDTACPSISHLFDGLADELQGEVLAILLSGMGRDGAAALARLKAKGALTLVQQPDSAVVSGMPAAAIELSAACRVQSPETMALTLNGLMRQA